MNAAGPGSQHSAVTKILPPTWNWELDVLLIVGEGAGAIAGLFASAGLKRVWVMMPAPLRPEPVPKGVQAFQSRGELHKTISMLKGESAGTLALLRTPTCSLPIEETNAIQSLATTILTRKRSFEHICESHAPRWAVNSLHNLLDASARPLVSDVGDAFSGVPMVIVGAGPSLEKNIDLLKEAKDKAIIVCVARALRSLQAAGISPHFAISLDCIDILSHFRGIPLDDIPGLLLSLTSDPNLYQLDHSGTLSFSSNTEAEGWMFNPEDGLVETPTGGSVSCSAMSIGLLWRCDPIILVGQDLAFTGGQVYSGRGPDGETTVTLDPSGAHWTFSGYSADLAHSLADRMVDGQLKTGATEVPGQCGNPVPTTPEMAFVRDWFTMNARDERGRTSMFNCTEGGAYIDGMTHASLRETLASLKGHGLDIQATIQGVRRDTDLSDRNARARAKHDATRRAIAEVVRLAQACVVRLDKALRQRGDLSKLQRLEKQLTQRLKSSYVLSVAAQPDIKATLAQASRAASLEESLAASRRLYTVIIRWGQTLLRS